MALLWSNRLWLNSQPDGDVIIGKIRPRPAQRLSPVSQILLLTLIVVLCAERTEYLLLCPH